MEIKTPSPIPLTMNKTITPDLIPVRYDRLKRGTQNICYGPGRTQTPEDYAELQADIELYKGMLAVNDWQSLPPVSLIETEKRHYLFDGDAQWQALAAHGAAAHSVMAFVYRCSESDMEALTTTLPYQYNN